MKRRLPAWFLLSLGLVAPAGGRDADIQGLARAELLVRSGPSPAAVAASPDGRVFVSEFRSDRVYEVVRGRTVVVTGAVEGPVGLAWEGNNRLLVVGSRLRGAGNRGHRRREGVLVRVELPSGRVTKLAEIQGTPKAVAMSAAGRVYVTAEGLHGHAVPAVDREDEDEEEDGEAHGRSQRHDSCGETGALLLWTAADGLRIVTRGFLHPHGVTPGAEGDVFVAAQRHERRTGSAFRVTVGGAVSVAVAERLAWPAGLARDPLGSLYVSGIGPASHGHRSGNERGVILKLAAGATAAAELARGAFWPRGIALAPSGDLLVADGLGDRILAFRAPPSPVLVAASPVSTAENPFPVEGSAATGTEVRILGGTAPVTGLGGAFRLLVPLRNGAENRLEVFAIGSGGRGLASRPASITVVHETSGEAPEITATVTPEANAEGWHRTDVTVTFTCVPRGSAIESCTPPVVIGTEGAGQVVTGTAVARNGRSATVDLRVSLDKTPPTVAASADPPPNANGWNNTDVTTRFQCTDALSGVASCSPPAVIGAEGAALVTGAAQDRAGNTAAVELTLNIDRTPPGITGWAEPPPNAEGWNNGDVVVSFQCEVTNAPCPPPVLVTGEGRGQVVEGELADDAGNTTRARLILDIDKTPPVLFPRYRPEPNAAGWNNTDVTVSWEAQDASSGLDAVTGPDVVSQEGRAVRVNGWATDRAGNTARAVADVALDKTSPVIVIASPANGSVRRIPRVEVTGEAQDAHLRSVVVNGLPADARFSTIVPLEAGPQPIVATAVDVAGNSTSAQVTVSYAPPPAVQITTPGNLTYSGSTPILVSGRADDPAASVVVDDVPATLTGETFSAVVPLDEGSNVITAVATVPGAGIGTHTITVVLDTQAPRIAIDAPRAASVVTQPTVTVTGRVTDITPGTVNAVDAVVTANNVPALVANRTFVARDVPLVPGPNDITARATDAVGNGESATITVFYEPPVDLRIAPASGDAQSAGIGETLAQPLVASVTDAQGRGIPGRTVVFRVLENDGALLDADERRMRARALTTDEEGRAAVRLVLGSRSGVGNNRVDATSPGIPGAASFFASAAPHPPGNIVVDSGSGQKGAVGQPLPYPFVAVVTDEGHNRLPGVTVTFAVTAGGGDFSGESEITLPTDSNGRAIALLTLGPSAGIENNIVTASVAVLPGMPAVFTATSLEPGDPAQTRLRGVVLDNQNLPIAGVTVRILNTAVVATTDAQGQFVLSGGRVGKLDLIVDGSTAQRPGTWPSLEYEVVAVPGADNTMEMPIHLLPLDLENAIFVDETRGGTLTLPQVPGFSLKVAPNAVTFPDGTRRGTLSVTPVNVEKVPMVPNFGQQPVFIVTIQPAGARFNPPAEITYPNVEGYSPGHVTELYSFDHDMGAFVATGTGTVSEDGQLLVSDAGGGVMKGGWFCGADPSTRGMTEFCGECEVCDGISKCVPDNSRKPPQAAKGDCKKEVCKDGKAASEPDDADAPKDKPCKKCEIGNLVNLPDDPPFTPPSPSAPPGVAQVNRDAVVAGDWGANQGAWFVNTFDCREICVGGERKYRLEGDITPSAAWTVEVNTRMQVPGCQSAPRTAANIQRTTVHETRHRDFSMGVINGHKSSFGTVYGSSAECDQAKVDLRARFVADFSAMAGRQLTHADFAGEMRYRATCRGGVSVEEPMGVTY